MASRQFKSTDTSLWVDKYGNGSDGAGSAAATVRTAFTATLGSTSATVSSGTGFAAGNLILIHQSRNGGTTTGGWEFNKILSVGGGTNWTLVYETTLAYNTTAQVYLMKQFSSYNGTLSVDSGWNGTIGGIAGFFCNGTATITSGSASSCGYAGGAGVSNANVTGNTGENTAAASTASGSSSANGGGGGNQGAGGANTASGGGGNGAAGDGSSGNGGSAAGNAGLTVMVFGGGGGSFNHDGTAPSGSAGGGILVVVAKTIIVSGSLTNGSSNTIASGAGSATGSAGTGAGGSTLLKGQNIILGTGNVTASSGDPATGVDRTGGKGGVGRIHADYGVSLTGTTTPTIDTTQDSILLELGGIMSGEI